MAATHNAQDQPGFGFSPTVRAFAATPYSIRSLPLAAGSSGTYQSLEAMAAAVRGEIPPDYSGWRDEYNQRAAARICGHAWGALGSSDIAALFNYVTHRITYLDHPPNQQVVQDARRTLQIGSGDCVSKSVLLATLLRCRGYPARFVAQCVDGEEFSHVYVEFQTDDGVWHALDPVASDKPMGWTQRVSDNGGFEMPYQIFNR